MIVVLIYCNVQMICYLFSNLSSENLQMLVAAFMVVSGLKINKRKTSIIYIGRDSQVGDNQAGIFMSVVAFSTDISSVQLRLIGRTALLLEWVGILTLANEALSRG